MTLLNQMVDTKVGRLHVELDGDGPPAVLWHSLFVDSATWSALRVVLRADRQLIIIDGPGHGKSSAPPPDFDLAECADAAIRVAEIEDHWGSLVGHDRFNEACYLLDSLLKELAGESGEQ